MKGAKAKTKKDVLEVRDEKCSVVCTRNSHSRENGSLTSRGMRGTGGCNSDRTKMVPGIPGPQSLACTGFKSQTDLYPT